MLPDIGAEILHFLTRRDLDKACGVSKWVDAMVAQCCAVYPLRPVSRIALYPSSMDATLIVLIRSSGFRGTEHSFSSIEDAVYFAASALQHSYVENLELGDYPGNMKLSRRHWTQLMDAFLSSAVRRLRCYRIDFSALNRDAFLKAVGCRGLQSLVVKKCLVPSGLVTDDLIRSSTARTLLQMRLAKNLSEPWGTSYHVFSEDAVLDFVFPADTAPGAQTRTLTLTSSGITDMFLVRFFERLQSSPARPSGSLKFYCTARQRGLSAYSHYLAPSAKRGMDATFRFPPLVAGNKPFEVALRERSNHMFMQFSLVRRSS